MKALFVSSSHETGTWLSEVTHPYWHLIERGIDVDFSSPPTADASTGAP